MYAYSITYKVGVKFLAKANFIIGFVSEVVILLMTVNNRIIFSGIFLANEYTSDRSVSMLLLHTIAFTIETYKLIDRLPSLF